MIKAPLLNKLIQGYKLPESVILAGIRNIYTLPNHKLYSEVSLINDQGSYLICECADYLSKQISYYILFDEFIDVRNFIARTNTPGIIIKPNGFQYTFLERKDFNLLTWLNKVKTDKSRIMGSYFNKITWKKVSICDSEMLAAAENKERKYKDFNYEDTILVARTCLNSTNSFAQIGMVEDQYLCAIVYIEGKNFAGKKITYVPFIDVTSDEVLQKRYKPMLMAHAHAVRTWYNVLNTELINFSFYYPYKANLNFNLNWCPGIMLDFNFIPRNLNL